VPSLVDVPDDLRAAVLAELAVRVHLGEHVLRRAAAEVSDRLVAAPTLLIYTSTAFRACGMSVIALKNRGINRSIKSSSEIIEKKNRGIISLQRIAVGIESSLLFVLTMNTSASKGMKQMPHSMERASGFIQIR
jgi:hypothetical protein